LREHLSELKQAMPPATKAPLINRWKLLRGWGFWAQLVPPLAVVILVTWGSWTDIIVAVASQNLAHVGDVKSGVLAEPRPAAPVLATVRPFEDFHVLAGWGAAGYERVITGHGIVGYIAKSSIIDGSGMADLRGRCFPFGPDYVSNGMVFQQTRVGLHTLKTTDGLSSDAVVKLRDMAGHAVLSFYVSAGGQATIDTVPEGVFTIEFATGKDFSPRCGDFLSDMASRRFTNVETFETQFQGNYRYTSVLEITLNPVVGGTAQTVSIDDSTFDRD
jgi:hypothetical protein